MIKLDAWQNEILHTEGNICVRSGRQVGKSTVISIKAGLYALEHPKTVTLIIASTERQAYLLFEKTLSYLAINHKQKIKKGKERPTKHVINLINGSSIHALPTGISGYGIRGYTVNLLIADEAAFIPDEVWRAVTPMMAVTKGSIIMLSTPFGKEGYFFESFNDPAYTHFHIRSSECPRISAEYLDQERKRMSKLQYAQEYEGEFLDELRQFFPTELIKSCLTLQRDTASAVGGLAPIYPPPVGEYYLGVDVARMGGDETVLATLRRRERDILEESDMLITEKTFLTDTIRAIKEHDKRYNYEKIYIDDGGMGVGVFDPLLVDDQTKRKVVAINNATRSLDNKHERTKKLFKEDLYNNLLWLMETHKIKLVNRAETFESLKSIQAEYVDGKLRIFGKYTHIVEALIRAAWCNKDKRLNIWIA